MSADQAHNEGTDRETRARDAERGANEMWFYPYTLKPRRSLSDLAGAAERHGALIRVGSGFADVHPWPELGDLPLDAQLALLARGELTPLTRRSMEMARVDASAREDGHSVFEGLQIPASHWSGDRPPAEFDTAKVKCGRAFDPATLPEEARLRLDCNAQLEPAEFLRVATRLPQARIDFIEDPCAYDDRDWANLKRQTGLRMAIDRGEGREADVLVVKPAIQDFPENSMKEIVVTSYMDHPLGQLGAAYVAARNVAHVSGRCGLMTHLLFEIDPFIEQMRNHGPNLLPPGGTGFGFDELLETLPWKRLR